jgi:hypothetical protein
MIIRNTDGRRRSSTVHTEIMIIRLSRVKRLSCSYLFLSSVSRMVLSYGPLITHSAPKLPFSFPVLPSPALPQNTRRDRRGCEARNARWREIETRPLRNRLIEKKKKSVLYGHSGRRSVVIGKAPHLPPRVRGVATHGDRFGRVSRADA